MEAHLNTRVLKRTTDLLKRVAHDKSPLASYGVRGNIALRAEGGRLYAEGSDSEIDIFANLPAHVVREGVVRLPAADLHKAMVACGKAKLADVRIANGGDAVTVGPVAMPCKVGEGDVAAPTGLKSYTETRVGFTMPETALRDMLEGVSAAISAEGTRYYLNGVHLHCRDGALCAVATDGYRLALYNSRLHVEWPEGAYSGTVIVPAKMVRLLVTAIGKQLAGHASVWITDARMGVRLSDGTVLGCKLIDGTFPDYDRVMPRGNPVLVDGENFLYFNLYDRLKKMGATKTQRVLLDRDMCEAYDDGADGLHWNLDGVRWPGPKVAFNAGYLMDIIKSYGPEHAGEITMALPTTEDGNHVSSLVLITESTGNLIWVLMPQRP